jgi:hypothetical protein
MTKAQGQPNQLSLEWGREIAAVLDNAYLHNLPLSDRGECQELNPATMKRCTGRMEASYITATPLLPSFPVWTCSACERKYVP